MSKITKHLPAILSGIATAGVIGTGVLSIRAGKKIAMAELEPKEKTWKFYIPPVLSGAATIGCLWAAHKISAEQIAVLTVSCGYLAANRDALEKKIKEHYGDDDLQMIQQEVKAELDTKNWGKVTIPRGVEETGKGNVLVIEGYSGRVFRSSVPAVRRGIRQFQQMFFDNKGFISLNDLYQCLGITTTHFGHQYGWPCWGADDLDEEFWKEKGGLNIVCEMVNEPVDLDEPVYCIDIYDYPMECWQEV